ncbi:MAG: Gfo/Idh/MocA family oxidoreductase, partial [Planctomycetes bacterium]|nr:Gfo/Idh/MocA family oxidoreductase [Planctomycetota bacterium]
AIGVGDQGLRDLKSFLARDDVRVIAVCDVDAGNRERARDAVKARQGEACPGYNDFREMLEKEAGIDAVLVVTPDHSHAAISIACMRKGKHVYCQKPMTHTVLEARRVAEAARASKVATQLGAVSQAGEGPRLLREWILDGAIGHVREVHNWSNRPIWPQEIDRPKDEPPVPPGLDWDLWLGPAPRRPYHPAYLPLVWRGWRDFGTGALGDMGCYSFDTIFRVLGLGAPEWVEASSSGFAPRMWAPVEIHRETYPRASIIRYRFPAREGMPPVDLTWCDGGLLPPRPDELDEDLPPEGLLFIGEKEKILCGFAGDRPRLIPRSRMDAYRKPPATLPRSPGHHEEWVRAIRGGEPAGANFEVSGRVTEALLLGNVAIRVRKKLLWDAAALKVTNVPEANPHLHAAYREPWTL